MYETRGTTIGCGGPDHARTLLVEPVLVLGPLTPKLCDVGQIVHPDREHLGGAGDGGEETDLVQPEARAFGDGVRRPLQRAGPAPEQLDHVARQADLGGRQVDDLVAHDHSGAHSAVVQKMTLELGCALGIGLGHGEAGKSHHVKVPMMIS